MLRSRLPVSAARSIDPCQWRFCSASHRPEPVRRIEPSSTASPAIATAFPMNPMPLAAMQQLAEDQVDIGFRDEAAVLVHKGGRRTRGNRGRRRPVCLRIRPVDGSILRSCSLQRGQRGKTLPSTAVVPFHRDPRTDPAPGTSGSRVPPPAGRARLRALPPRCAGRGAPPPPRRSRWRWRCPARRREGFRRDGVPVG